jgi:predicted nucleic acid-binding protein
LGCQTLYSEDLQHGVSYEGLRVINPFLAPHSFSQDP